jgi:putative Mg2+ transporter-C (MgtC) family protein
MACGAGMPVLAVTATLLYLIAVGILTLAGQKIPMIDKDQIFVIQYKDGRGVLRSILTNATQLGYGASLTDTRKIENPGKVPRVEARMRFTGHKIGPLEDLVEGFLEIRGVTSVHVTKSEND